MITSETTIEPIQLFKATHVHVLAQIHCNLHRSYCEHLTCKLYFHIVSVLGED